MDQERAERGVGLGGVGRAGVSVSRVFSRVSGVEGHAARMRHTLVRSPAVAALTRASGSASSSFLPCTTRLACRQIRELDERLRAKEKSGDKIPTAFVQQCLQNADLTPY